MSVKQCDECEKSFDSHKWHPAMLAGDDEKMCEFCSQECKEAFLAGTEPVTDSPQQ